MMQETATTPFKVKENDAALRININCSTVQYLISYASMLSVMALRISEVLLQWASKLLVNGLVQYAWNMKVAGSIDQTDCF